MKKLLFAALVGVMLSAVTLTAAAAYTVALDESNFPDDNFRKYVSENFDKDTDGYLSAGEIAEAKEIHIGSSHGVTELWGVENLTELESLSCSNSPLGVIDISTLTGLKHLSLYDTELTELNLTGLTELEYLNISFNQITELDISHLTKLKGLEFGDNPMAPLDLSGLDLERLDCGGIPYKTLDVSHMKDLMVLKCYNCQLTELDLTGLNNIMQLDISNNQIKSIDISHLTQLRELEYGGNPMAPIDISRWDLVRLNCSGIAMTELDTSHLGSLTYLNCSNCKLTKLDTSELTNLEILHCYNNRLTELDVSGNKNLRYVSVSTGNKEANVLLTAACGTAISSKVLGDTFDLSRVQNNRGFTVDAENKLILIDENAHELYYEYRIGYGEAVLPVTIALTCVNHPDIELNAENFPDDNFRAYVSGRFDRDGNGSLSGKEIASAVSVSISQEDGIKDLTGISYFTNLTSLYCSGCQLETLDVSALTELTSLRCSNNLLTELDVSSLVKLEYLVCSNNQLAELDVSNLKNLQALDCGENGLIKTLDVGQLTELVNLNCSNNQIKALDVRNLTKLTELYCDTNEITELDVSRMADLQFLYCYSNQLTALDLSANDNLLFAAINRQTVIPLTAVCGAAIDPMVFGEAFDASRISNYRGFTVDAASGMLLIDQNAHELYYEYDTGYDNPLVVTAVLTCETHPDIAINAENFPDANFRTLVANYFDRDNNGVLSAAEITAANAVSIWSNNGITDLTGIEHLTGLESLTCFNLPIKELNVSTLTNLKDLTVYDAELTTLDLTSLTELECLNISFNQIREIDISHLTKLRELEFANNPMEPLDLSGLHLETLDCSWIPYKKLDVSHMTDLISLNCGGCQLTELDLRGLNKLTSLNFSNNQIKSIDISHLTQLKDLHYGYNPMAPIDVSRWNLVRLDCSGIAMTELDVSHMTNLRELNCSNCQLTTLDTSELVNLEYLHCYSNYLTELDLSKNTKLYYVDITNHNNTVVPLKAACGSTVSKNIFGETFEVSRVINTCGFTVDPAAGTICIDENVHALYYEYQTGYSDVVLSVNVTLTCEKHPDIALNETNFPDAFFRTQVANIFDRDSSGTLSQAEIDAAVKLELYGQFQMTSLKGIEYLTNLESLVCNHGLFADTEIDLSALTKLTHLTVYDSGLKTLDLSKLTGLKHLSLVWNQLTELDISRQTELEALYVDANDLTELDISHLKNLKELSYGGNPMAPIGVSEMNLSVLSCQNIPMDALDVSHMTNLTSLNCSNCQLKTLNVTGLTNLWQLACSSNLLTELDLSTNINLTSVNLDGYRKEVVPLMASCGSTLASTVFGESFDLSGMTNVRGFTVDSAAGTIRIDENVHELYYEYQTGYRDVVLPVTVALTCELHSEIATVLGRIFGPDGATVSLVFEDGTVAAQATTQNGFFTLSVPAGRYTMYVEKEGFVPNQLSLYLKSGEYVENCPLRQRYDFNGNGTVDADDVRELLSYILYPRTYTNVYQTAVCDTNGDNVLDMQDAVGIMRRVLGVAS